MLVNFTMAQCKIYKIIVKNSCVDINITKSLY